MRWLDAHFDPTTSIELFLGPVGVTLYEGEDGMLHYADTPEGLSYSEFRYGHCPVHVPCAIAASQWNKDIEVMAEDADRWIFMEEVLKPYLTQRLLYEYQTAEDSKFRLSVGKDIDEYVKTVEARWLMEGGVDEEWDAFQSQLVSMGIDQYTQIMQGMVDRFNKAGE